MDQELFDQIAGFAKTAYQYDGEIAPRPCRNRRAGRAGSSLVTASSADAVNKLPRRVSIHKREKT